MVFTSRSDAELRRLVLEDGEMAPGAREELERRHYQALRAFAYVVSPSEGDVLAGQAWEQALRPLDEDSTGAVRPRALSAVLRVAADWLRMGQRSALATALVSWFESDGTDATDATDAPEEAAEADAPEEPDEAAAVNEPDGVTDGGAGAARLASSRCSSITAKAFERIPVRSQTVLWHHEVERDDDAAVYQLLGPVAEDVDLLNRRARRELYDHYVFLHQDETVDDACRHLHRMLLVYADATSMVNTPVDLVSHLGRCAHCARAVDDLTRMRFELGSLLAKALLPWGGADYPRDARTSPSTTPGDSAEEEAGSAEAGRRGEGGDSAGARRRPRARRFVLAAAAVVGVCSLGAAVAYKGGWLPVTEKHDVPHPGKAPSGASPPPAPVKPPAQGDAPGNGYRASSVRGAALEWLFDRVDADGTADTSGNGIDGKLNGDPLPRLAKGGVLEFSDAQSVISAGPVVDTSKSYSVSARAKLKDTADYQTVISQDAEEISGFALQYDPGADRWEMIIPEQDKVGSERIQAGGRPGPPVDRWTYLTGVYDAADGEIRLYVDGKLADTAPVGGAAGRRSGSAGPSTTPARTTPAGRGGLDDGDGDGDSGGSFKGDFKADSGGFSGSFSETFSGSRNGFFSGRPLAFGINQDLTGSLNGPQVVQAGGHFAVGRALAGNVSVRGFDGAVDDVRAFKRALTGKEVASLAGR